MLTLNSQQEYRQAETRLMQATRILVVGAGLIGSELAMDMAQAGKHVMVADRASHLLSALLPAELSARLQTTLQQQGVELLLGTELQQVEKTEAGLRVTLVSGRTLVVDEVISAIGLRANTGLAAAAGLSVNRGIVTDSQLRTSDPHIYALGDCAEINGKLLPFLQPIQLTASIAANSIAARLTPETHHPQPQEEQPLTLPAMLIKVKNAVVSVTTGGGNTKPGAHLAPHRRSWWHRGKGNGWGTVAGLCCRRRPHERGLPTTTAIVIMMVSPATARRSPRHFMHLQYIFLVTLLRD
ncbi:hypothetical protein OS42_09500 [Dickeya oryzae]